ncbi:MAG: hypothetical protein A2X08_01830 [Bacteroidetes bacterium GWA2_32_17]|nr:MAG: hypothetical protein A2X08_01830 [Bacteroidetes bacterium GWA2_32_17]
MKKTILIFTALIVFKINTPAQTVTDYDGNIYNTITIGTQIWTKENLKVTHYPDGILIPNITDSIQWKNLTTSAYCNYNNTDSFANIYGHLYNWYAVNYVKNVCPSGWHVPSDFEWVTLTTYLGGENVAGGKMKEAGTTHWSNPNTGATNSSGFTALPGGDRNNSGGFENIGKSCLFWSSIQFNDLNALYRYLNYYSTEAITVSSFKTYGFSVRCLKDTSSNVNIIDNSKYLNIYPTLATTQIYIDYKEIERLNLTIYNVVGKCMLQKELNNGSNKIDISFIPQGIYVIKVSSTNWTIQQKLIKE